MFSSAEKYEFELYLEGIKTPFSGMTLTLTGNGASANIVLSIDKYIRNILPNTLVHVFFRRYGEDWRLLFEGYVHGKTESISSSGSSLAIQCKDISFHLDIMWKFYSNSATPAEYAQKIIRHFGAPTDPVNPFSRFVQESKRQQQINEAKTVLAMIHDMIEEILTWKEGSKIVANTFFQRLYYAARFMDRFYYEDDSKIEYILSAEAAKNVFRRSPFNALQTMRTVMDFFLSQIYYHVSYLSSPSYISSNLRQIILKPNNFLMPAPMCNVVFPNMISGFDYSRNFLAEPTRLSVPSQISIDEVKDEQWQYLAYAPYEMKEIKDFNQLHYGLINDEIYKGIYPVIEQIPQTTRLLGVSLTQKDKKESNSAYVAMKFAAEYLLQLRQTQTRTFNSGECVFNPNLVVNYPAVVIKSPSVIMGNIVSITHSLSANGRINTSFAMSNCRSFDLELDTDIVKEINNKYGNVSFDWASCALTDDQRNKAKLLGEDVYPYPFWLNDKYLPGLIDNTYSLSLGCKSIMNILGDPNSTAKIENVRALYKEYKTYEDRGSAHRYTTSSTSRPIITKDDYFIKYLGLKKQSDDIYSNLSGDDNKIYFKDTHRDIIFKYVKNISKGAMGY